MKCLECDRPAVIREWCNTDYWRGRRAGTIELIRKNWFDGLTLDHLCHNADLTCSGGPSCRHRRCVNPDHLEPVPSGTNVGRANSTRHIRRAVVG